MKFNHYYTIIFLLLSSFTNAQVSPVFSAYNFGVTRSSSVSNFYTFQDKVFFTADVGNGTNLISWDTENKEFVTVLRDLVTVFEVVVTDNQIYLYASHSNYGYAIWSIGENELNVEPFFTSTQLLRVLVVIICTNLKIRWFFKLVRHQEHYYISY